MESNFLMHSHERNVASHFLSDKVQLGNVLTVLFDIALATIVKPFTSKQICHFSARERWSSLIFYESPN